MSLNDQLEQMRGESWGRWSPEKRALLYKVRDDIAASGIIERALNRGDTAPQFALTNTEGHLVRSKELLSKGPLVLSFYRGHW